MTTMVANPGATVKGLAYLAKNPIKAGKMIVKEGAKSCAKDKAACAGKLAFEVVSNVLTAGGASGAKASSKLGKGKRGLD